MKKRLLSLLLATAMLFSLLPSFTVGAEKEQNNFKFVYNFNLDGSKGTILKVFDYEYTHNMWMLSPQSTAAMYDKTQTHEGFGVQSGISTYAENEWLAFSLNVPFVGTYKISLIRGMSHTGGGFGDFYLFRPGTEITAELLAEAEPLNAEEIPYYDYGKSTKQCSPMILSESFTVDEAGKWIAVFKPTRNGYGSDGIEEGAPGDAADDGDAARMYISSLTLNAGEMPAAMQVVPEKDFYELSAGAYKTVYITAYLSDGSVAGDGDCNVTFESADESVAKVSPLGLISGISEGKTKIKITAEKNGTSAEAEVDVAVLGNAEDTNALSSVEIEVADGYAKIKSARMTDGSDADLTNAKVTYGVENLSVAGIDEKTGEIIPGRTSGSATVYATVELDGVCVTGKTEAEITPSGGEASGVKTSFDFYQVDRSGWAGANIIENNDAHNNDTYVKSGRDIWFITDEYTTDAWEWAYTDHRSDDYKWQKSVALLDLEPDTLRLVLNKKWIAFRIDVPESGIYWPNVNLLKSKATGNGVLDVYIFPESELTDTNKDSRIGYADVASYIRGKAAHGELSFKSTDEKYLAKNEALPKISLQKGKNILLLKNTSGSPANTHYISSVILDGTNAMRTVNLNFDKTTIDFGKGETQAKGEVCARLRDGTLLEKEDLSVTYGSDNEEVVTFKNGVITAVRCGKADVYVTASYNGTTLTSRKTITVTDTGGVKALHLSAGDGIAYEGEKLLISAYAEMNSGKSMPVDNSETEFEIVGGKGKLLAGGYITNSEDISEPETVQIVARTAVLGESCESEPLEVCFNPSTLKDAPTYYTYERRAAAEENIKKHDWAREELELYKSYCEAYLSGFDVLYKTIIGEGVPRSNQVGEYTDITDYAFCRYCGKDIDGKYTVSMYSRQWKVQCPECKRLFPSNDFEKFLTLGIEEDGTFNREKALVANGKLCGTIAEDGTVIDEENPYGYGVSKGYLYNETYSELRTEGNVLYNKDPRTGEKADGNVWGVDDGMGYRPDGMYKNSKVSSRHTYAAYYLHTALIEVHRAIKWLSTVYAYTGDEAYGVKGAILLDRLADVYPTFHFKQYYNDDYKFFVSHGNTGFGKIFGCINDCEYTFTCLRAADALYPLLESENEALISVLSSKANEYGYINRNEDGSINEKKSGSEIWHSWENKLVREAYRAVNEADLEGNYGQVQKVVATAALVLDSEPESKQMVDWIFRYGETKYSGDKASQTGGLLSSKLIDDVDRDGMGDEAAPGYNIGWLTDLYDTAEVLELYGNPEYNLFANAKFAKMFTAGIPVALVDTHTAQIGDTQATANIGFSTDMQIMVNGFKQLRNTRLGKELAEYIYRTNGYSVKGLHYDIYTFDSTSVQRDIADMIDDDVAAKSEMMPGYGFAVLRDGGAYGDIGTSTYTNNMRDFWIYFGRNEGHGHWDTLNLGIEAYGLNFSPDNGTPEKKSNNRPRYQWTEATLAHNTVNVNALRQLSSGYHGTPLHFDDSGDVKLMDVDASQVYSEASVYRRTLVMINAGPDTSYAVDFFRVKGGNEHIYSFHAQSDSAEFDEIDISKVVSQTDEQTGEYIGSYEGRDVPWDVRMDQTEKTTQFENIGKSMLGEVRRAGEDALSGDTFAVDFRISDFNKVLKSGSKGLRMRLTMLNDDNDNVVTELALAKGKNTGNASNGKIPDFEYALVKREGENLDTLYTSVIEPYKDNRIVSDIKEVRISVSPDSTSGEGADDAARALKITRADGRVDYVVYATNNAVLYTVTDEAISFDFRGFAGLYSLNKADGEVIYKYVNDGDIIGNRDESFERAGYAGIVSNYTQDEFTLDNFITLTTESGIDTESLAGKYVYVANDGVQNAVYRIYGAEYADENETELRLDIGAVTTVRGFADKKDISLGYIHNIKSGQSAYIPISNIEEFKPVFEADDVTVSAGSTLALNLSATPVGNARSITYIGTALPRGASLDAETGKFSWKPDSAQVGKNHVAVTARDDYGRETVVHFTVTVYGSTTGSSGNKNENDSGDNSGTSSENAGTAGGGGGGGGAAPTDKPDTDDEANTDNENSEDGENSPDASSETDVIRFTDISNHAWAADAIHTLADDGIIRGTTSDTYSPGRNITRADFASLLVRAFELKSDNTENFADVSASDYFAAELAVARNTGIVNGIGDNKFAPRNTITRQDMMVIVYRALNSLPLEGKVAPQATDEVLSQYPDFDTVASYAKEAVSALISAGLVNGKSGRIAPTDYTTRAEVAVLIKRMLDYIQ